MPLRALWKGVLSFGKEQVPVKLYTAIEDRSVHFRLLHRSDLQPVNQKMVNGETGKEVTAEQTRKGVEVGPGKIVILEQEELDKLQPEPSRIIRINSFLPAGLLNHQWYDRPYFLVPDGDAEDYWCLFEALGKQRREGLAHWVMRDKEYIGALRAEDACLTLISLRFADQIIFPEEIKPPSFREFHQPEIEMARQLVGMMTAEYRPEKYQDEYRDRILKLIDIKRKGGKLKLVKSKPRKESTSLADALAASLAGMKGKADG